MDTSHRALTRTWRRWLFWAWVAASVVVAAYIGIAGPFAAYFGEGRWFVAFALPALMFFMLATGAGWLVLLSKSRPHRPTKAGEQLDRAV